MIIPNSFLTNNSSKFIKDNLDILCIKNFNSEIVFKNINIYTCIITCKKK